VAEETGISWCDRTWSPWIGCTKVSPACDGCYAAHLMDTRLGRVEWGPHGERKRTAESYWRNLTKWDREAKAAGRVISVFPSLCDPWDNAADPGIRREWFAVMRETPNLLHLLLSKRPQNAVAMAEAAGGLPGNAALGATVEDQKRANSNVPHLLLAKKQLGARIAFLSCEPLLGPVDLTDITTILFRGAEVLNGLTGELEGMFGDPCSARLPGLDWVITGGETDQGSHKARPTHPDWFRQIRDACADAGVPHHHKQNGEWLSADGWYADHPVSLPLHGWSDQGWGEATADEEYVARIGKKRAGRLLDGVEHNGMPEVRP
jgi:protein gp37